MVQRRQRERSLFEVLLPDGHKLWPDWLRKIDTLLENEAVIDVVAHALGASRGRDLASATSGARLTRWVPLRTWQCLAECFFVKRGRLSSS